MQPDMTIADQDWQTLARAKLPEQQRGKVLRRGKVLAVLRPVSITLQETLLDPPCCVTLRLHWRLEPTDDGACVLLDARYSLNGAATLRS